MVARSKALLYRQFFYCPAFKFLGETLARLDRVQTIIPHYLTVEPTSVALSPDALAILLTMVRGLFAAEPDKDFMALKELLFEALPEEARPAIA
jgi:hypothetical protein